MLGRHDNHLLTGVLLLAVMLLPRQMVLVLELSPNELCCNLSYLLVDILPHLELNTGTAEVTRNLLLPCYLFLVTVTARARGREQGQGLLR